MSDYLPEFVSLMQNNDLNDIVIKTFSSQYKKVLSGETGIIPENTIRPPQNKNLINLEELSGGSDETLEKLVVLKLNGGLGTSMGLSRAKSLLKVKGEYTFLDIIALQILKLREQSGMQTPVMFMNSFNTREDTLSKLSEYNELKVNKLPLDLLQNKFPKIRQSDLSPFTSKDEKLNWNPPGHLRNFGFIIRKRY